MTLPPFNPEAACPKCGHDNVSATYAATGNYCARHGLRWSDGEHLCRVCQRCHYQWAEAVIDALAPAAGPVAREEG